MSDGKQTPNRRGEEHRSGQEPEKAEQPAEQQAPKRTPQEWDSLINRRIEEAMQRGDFDNLRGKGKPLNTAPDPHTPPEMQMANSLLKNNDLSPAWISDRAAVLALIERFREKLRATAADFAQARSEAPTPQRLEQLDELWGRYVEAWRAEVVEINKRILTQNLKQPVTFLEIIPLRLESELRRL